MGTGVPLLYYAILGKADINWKLAQLASKHAFSFWSIALAVVPLLLPALVAYRKRPATFLAAATRTWPLVAFGIFLLSGTSLGATPLHAFQGITLPLSVLAVEGLTLLGWRRLPRPVLIGAVLVGAVHDPGHASRSSRSPTAWPRRPSGTRTSSRPDEKRALDYLARDKDPGSVMTRSYLGALVPGRTGRRTYVGDCLWSEPGCLTLTCECPAMLFMAERRRPSRAAAASC